MKNDDKTQIIDTEATQIIDTDATQVMRKGVKTLNEIVRGDVIEGYVVGEPISEKGGEATIRLAEKNGEKYVIKVFRNGHSTDNETEDVLVKLKSPYVMPIVDRGDYKGIHYEILPYYRNGTFGDLLGKKGLDWLMMFIRHVNEGLRAIHDVNVFHNDIKPENVFISDDWKTAVIGDFGISRFGAERTHVTNTGNMTKYYAAPEANEMSNERTDYFSFGMSIADIAFGKRLYEGLSGKQARNEIISGRGLSLPSEIPEDVRDLITMLTRYNPQDRITYEGVNRWLGDTKCFNGCRDQKEHTGNGLIINEYRFGERGAKVACRDTYELALAMNDNLALALPQYRDGFLLNAIKTAPQQDPELYYELEQIYKRYSADLSFGLFLTLHTLNPNLPVKYAGKELSGFKDYINMLRSDYGKGIDSHFANKDFLNILLEHSKILDDSVELIRTVMESYKTPIDIFDMFLNLFGGSEQFYYDNVVYGNFGDFLNKKAFADGVPQTMKWKQMRNKFLTSYMTTLGASKEEIKNIVGEKDLTTEYFRLGKILNGYIPLRLCDTQVKNFYDLVELIANKKEGDYSGDLEKINNFLNNDGFIKIARFESTPLRSDLVDNIKKASNKISYIYFFCYRHASFMDCVTIKDLVTLLGRQNSYEIERVSETILASQDFVIWMKRQGVRI